MKKLQPKIVLLLVLVIVLLAGSCKKNETIKDPLEEAKSWYINSISKAKIGLLKNAPSEIGTKANKEVMASISPEVNWTKSRTYLLEDGTELTTAPMSIEIEGAVKPEGSFLLLIYKKADKYESLVAYNENKDYFQGSFSKPEIQVLFSTTLAKNIEKTANKKGTNPNLKVRPDEPPVCYDAYWVTYVEDAYGNPIEILSVTYLYTWCVESGGGSGDEDDDEEIPMSGTIQYYMPLTEDDYAVDSSEVSLTGAVGIPTQIYFDAYWDGSRMKNRKTIQWLRQYDVFGYPVHEEYYVKGKGKVTRALTWVRGEKDFRLLPPINSAAHLWWKYTPTVRYRFHNPPPGVTDYERYGELENDKWIMPWDDVSN